jgi:hypothetical protein
MKLCCFLLLDGIAVPQVVNFALDPVKPVKQLRHVRTELRTGNVVTGNLFSGLIQQNAEPIQLVKLAFKQEAHDSHYGA